MKRLMLAMAVVVCLVPFRGTAARAEDEQLTVTQDERSMEESIARYLRARHSLIVTEKVAEGEDLYLVVPMKGDPMPKFGINIDTQCTNRGADGKVIERAVRVLTLTGVKVPAEKQDTVLRIINDFNRRRNFSAVYIDTDREVVLDWTLNVLSVGLPIEYVYDSLARENKSWHELYHLVSAALQ
ncbi:MAG: YbjN domain-containing protein [Elusimicrobia bacterium]|nr:YbjN domain-containing protein [Elusimicrobiota bacterium]